MSTTVDEFGRVIPAATPLASSRGGPRNEPPPPPPPATTRDRGRSQSPPASYRGGGRGRGRGRSSRHYSTHHSTTSSRDRERDRDYHRDRDHHSSGGGGGSTSRDHHRRDRDHHHHSSSSSRQHHHHHHHHPDGGASRGRDRDSGGGREWRKRRRSPSSSGPSSLQGHPPSQQHTTASVDGGLGASSPPRSTSRLRHPSYRYVEVPMLCEYVWKSQHEGDKNGTTTKNENNEGDNNDTAIDDSNNSNNNNANINDDSSTTDKKPTLVVKEEPQDDNDNDKNTDDKDAPDNGNYIDYRKKYCLNYVRSFFNQHMDDSWFRNRYSPLGKKRTILAERERAKHEAQVFGTQLQASLQQQESSPNNSSEDRCSFVQQARLGGGIKTSFSNNADLVVPATQKLSVANPDNVLHITDVPPHITDEQLHLALMYHCMIPADEQAEGSPVMAPDATKLVSGTVIADRDKNPLWREAFFICSAAVKQDIVTHLAKAEAEGHLAAAAAASTTTSTAANASATADKLAEAAKADESAAVVVPRKEKDKDDKFRATLPLDVECSDPYGRLDVDADGKGGAPEDGVGVPPRKSTVWVNTQYKPPPVLVLSAAVSSKERLGRDKEAASMMARALDVAKDIPLEHRLDEVLDKLFGVNRNTQEAEDPSIIEDTLDVAIAYLRRVHLFSFYNGCTFASSVADVLSGRHPAGTIHLRLKNADEILAQDNPPSKSVEYINSNGDNNVVAPPKDLLASRLDASIATALEECNQWINRGGATIVSEEVDQEAAELEEAEEEWKDTWLENHAIIDDDGRARCSFHFCHKLFKDKNFLRKHLLKKHREFLRAEQAQLHDEYMMKAWDEEDQRPVPPILVDCGANFDLVPSAVVGAEPTAEDPEPELWRKEEERRKREEEMREQRQQQRRNRENQSEHSNPGGGEERRSHHSNAPPPRVKNFVDPDDMKEEKVEMSFDNIDVPVQPPKKKKKKKLL